MLVRTFNRAITKIHNNNYDLSMVYIDTLKTVAKKYGPNSKEAMNELAMIDEVLQVTPRIQMQEYFSLAHSYKPMG